jgi:signal transduction histidine kinase
VKFSPSGAVVSVAAHRNGEVVELVVADEGQGIPQSERDRIFAKFYRLPTSGPGGGTGLGLSIVQGLVSAMGGTIRVDSADGEGSVFVVELPAAGAMVAEREPEAVA